MGEGRGGRHGEAAGTAGRFRWRVGEGRRREKKTGVDVSDHQLVNLYLRVWPGWCARRTQGFILVRAECPYVQSAAARVTGTSL